MLATPKAGLSSPRHSPGAVHSTVTPAQSQGIDLARTLPWLRKLQASCEILNKLSLAHVGVVSHRTRASIDALHLLQTPPLHRVLGAAEAALFRVRAEQVESLEQQVLEGASCLQARVNAVEVAIASITSAVCAAVSEGGVPASCTPPPAQHLTQTSWTAASSKNIRMWLATFSQEHSGGVVSQLVSTLDAMEPAFAASAAFLQWAHDQIRWAEVTAGQLHLHACGLRTAVRESCLLAAVPNYSATAP